MNFLNFHHSTTRVCPESQKNCLKRFVDTDGGRYTFFGIITFRDFKGHFLTCQQHCTYATEIFVKLMQPELLFIQCHPYKKPDRRNL